MASLVPMDASFTRDIPIPRKQYSLAEKITIQTTTAATPTQRYIRPALVRGASLIPSVRRSNFFEHAGSLDLFIRPSVQCGFICREQVFDGVIPSQFPLHPAPAEGTHTLSFLRMI